MESHDGSTAAPEISPPPESGSYAAAAAEEQVMSEVHLGCPPGHAGPHISRFTIFQFPLRDDDSEDTLSSMKAKAYEVDEDGDLILTRRCNPTKDSFVVNIQHNITSSIPRVGLQNQGTAASVTNFLLSSLLPGLVGMLLARAAKTVFITDHGDEVLENCAKNIHLNAEILNHKASVYVRELDWNQPWPPEIIANSPSQQSYGWSTAEIEELERASLLLAADVIYSDDLTDAFFRVLELIMSNRPEKVLYLALEKRYNFTIDDLDVAANGYAHFRSYLKDEQDEDLETEFSPRFTGRLIDLEEIPQYVQEYDRGNDVEIWEIRRVKLKA